MTPTVDLHTFLRTRRSVRRFKPDAVPDAVLQEILVTAAHAPSAHNRQPWRFAVIADLVTKRRLAQAMAVDFTRDLQKDGTPAEMIETQRRRSVERITSAPVIVLLCLDMREMDAYPDEKRRQAERTMAVQSVAAAGLQLLLGAHAEGLGAVWACWPLFAGATIQKTLNLTTMWEPQAMFFLGYPDSLPKKKEMKDLQNLIRKL